LTSNHAKIDTLWPAHRRIFGPIQIVSTTAREAAEELSYQAASDLAPGRHVHLVNAYTLALAEKDPAYAGILSGEAVNLPDGKPVSVVSKMLRQVPLLRQVRGPQLFLDIFDVGRSHGLRHFLLGSSPEVLESLQKRLTEDFPGCNIVGLESPPYRPLSTEEYESQDKRIRAASPHIVWVGLGTPKQDAEAQRLAKSTGVTAIAVGAAFDFAAGRLPEAPLWMTRCGLEWLFRLASEPRRLWKRYLFGNARFLMIVMKSFCHAYINARGSR
jgi:N-acetylglucosaminyldiphosphoundecaprenol N-acetyl-beta-D-mannosaminyltransferase